MTASARQGRDLFRRAGGFRFSAAIGKAHDGVRRRDIDKLRIWS
jgi:hypothetical protein